MPAKRDGRGAPGAPAHQAGELVDRFGRIHRSLRLSVTDRCNLRCSYCMPSPEVVFLPRGEILAYEEFEILVRAGARLGIRKVRVTGGEPLVRRDVHRLIRALAGLDGIEDLGLTTNGYRLKEMCGDLKRAGLRRVTVSLDTLRRDRFRILSGADALDRVLEGVEAVREAGLTPVKINAVLMRGVNDDEILESGGVGAGDGSHYPVHRGHACRRRSGPGEGEAGTRGRGGGQDRPGIPPGPGAPRRSEQTGQDLPLRRRPGGGRVHQPGDGALLQHLRPRTDHRRRQDPQLPVRSGGTGSQGFPPGRRSPGGAGGDLAQGDPEQGAGRVRGAACRR